MNHTLYSGYYLNKRAEAHKACNDSLVNSAYLGAVSYCIDNEDCLLCIVKVNRGNKYLTVLAHVNLAVALGANLLDGLAAGADDLADLVHVGGGERQAQRGVVGLRAEEWCARHEGHALLDGAARIPDLVARAKSKGQTSLAITDHGVMYGVVDFYRACKKEGIHTCLDTNGFVRRYDPVIDELLEVTDLVMLDLKQMNDEIHQNLVGVSNHRTLEFAQYLAKKNINVWIRYVVVPGWSDDDDSAHRLGEFTRDMGNVEKIELLPYHELGKHKWVAMGEEYKLDGVHPPKKETMERVKGILEQYGHKVMY